MTFLDEIRCFNALQGVMHCKVHYNCKAEIRCFSALQGVMHCKVCITTVKHALQL